MWLNIQFSTVLNAFTMGHFAVYQYVPFFFFCCCQTVRQKNLQQCRNSTLFLRSFFFLVYVFHFYFYSSMKKNLCELKMEIREPNPLKYARISILGNYLSFKCLLWMWNVFLPLSHSMDKTLREKMTKTSLCVLHIDRFITFILGKKKVSLFISLEQHEIRTEHFVEKRKLSKMCAISFIFLCFFLFIQRPHFSFYFSTFIIQNSRNSSWLHIKRTSQRAHSIRL